ncbi:hypothetical protein ACFPOU_21795 [Massilia jejuensis]|uniref:Uncharacterized protein n=1 Tax=Massilia jejuensis TaxID=648894 RepID=A0ABW0PP05_9BURK
MRPILLCVLSLPLLAHAEPGVAVAAPVAATTPALPLRARLDKETIRAAIAALPAERHPDPGRREAPALSATAHDAFARDFAAARLPDCLHAEGLRNQPTFFLGGVLALPFIAVAKLRGVCR